MTIKLPDELRLAIEQEPGGRLDVIDVTTNVHYVLMRAEHYDNLSARSGQSKELDSSELYPLMAKSAAAAGWDDPDLDAYNDYDANKKP